MEVFMDYSTHLQISSLYEQITPDYVPEKIVYEDDIEVFNEDEE